MIRLLFLFITLTTVAACSSPPAQIHYFQFDNHTDASASNSSSAINAKNNIIVREVRLPGYLTQSMIVMQTTGGKMHFSTSNLWAMQPEKAITQSIVGDLQQQLPNIAVYSWLDPMPSSKTDDIHIHISHFYPTENGDVILAGRVFSNINGINSQAPFYYESQISSDGYASALAEMRKQVKKLANKIAASIKEQ